MSLPQTATTLVLTGSTGVLSTHSAQYPGFPFGSFVPYAAEADGSVIFFLSKLAVHTRNLQTDARASFFIQQENGSARLTLLGQVRPADASHVSQLYLARNQEAHQWQHFPDFAYHRLTPSHLYLVEGFGKMGWIPAEEYRNACLTI